jgi:hypothetical protein
MKKYNWFLLGSMFTLISVSSNSFGQGLQSFSPPPSTTPYFKAMEIFRRGINVIITADSLSHRWGIEIERLEDAAQKGVQAAGWVFNSVGDRCITVIIDSLTQSGDSSCIFKIDADGIRKTIEMKKQPGAFISNYSPTCLWCRESDAQRY